MDAVRGAAFASGGGASAWRMCAGGGARGQHSSSTVCTTRRTLLGVALSLPLLWASQPPAPAHAVAAKEKINLTEEEWRKRLPEDAFLALRKNGTERPFSSPLNTEKRRGTYVCRGCSTPLFNSSTKYDSGTGWPSFNEALPAVEKSPSPKDFFTGGTEVHCGVCGGHIGHVFGDGPRPSGKRYCINGVAIGFQPA